jgi:hypothetical protein
MRSLTRSLIVLAAVVATTATVARAQPAPGSAPQSARCGNALAPNVYRLCFDGQAWQVDEPTNSRFTNRDRVEVEVQHFNFLRYTLAFDVQEEKSEAYQYLTKLWTSILNPDILQAFALGETTGPRAVDLLVEALRDLYRREQALDRKITSIASRYRKTGLTGAEAAALRAAVSGPGQPACAPADFDAVNKPEYVEPSPGGATADDPLAACTVVEIARGLNASYARLNRLILVDNEAFTDAISGGRKALYNLVSGAYADVRKRADTFVSLAEKTADVETKKAGKHEAGTRVTLTLSAIDEGGAKTPIADVNYFVETTMPLVIHGGVAFTGLRQVSFDTVKRASAFGEEELFQKTAEAETGKSFSAFLSWTLAPLVGTKSGPHGAWLSLLASLGTDVSSPGSKIFVGPTLLFFGRMAFTGGVAFGTEKEGQVETLDPDIFRVIRSRPAHSYFFSLTTKVH